MWARQRQHGWNHGASDDDQLFFARTQSLNADAANRLEPQKKHANEKKSVACDTTVVGVLFTAGMARVLRYGQAIVETRLLHALHIFCPIQRNRAYHSLPSAENLLHLIIEHRACGSLLLGRATASRHRLPEFTRVTSEIVDGVAGVGAGSNPSAVTT